jgi:MFS family permease
MRAVAMRLKRGFFGWRVVAGAFILAVFGWGLGFYGPPVYLEAIRQSRGWPVGLIAAAVTTHYLVGAVAVANLPALHRRLGLGTASKLGAVLLSLGVFGWAIAIGPWQLFAAAACSGAGWATMGGAAVNAVVSPWFVRGRPAALSTAYNGASIGGVIFSPLWVAAIGVLGFPSAAAIVGAVTILTMWLVADRWLAQTPEGMGLRPDGDAAEPEPSAAASSAQSTSRIKLWRNRQFLTLAAAMSLGLFAQVGLLAHLFSLLVPPLGAQAAGWAMGFATACAIGGRFLVGWLMPAAVDRRLVAAANQAVQLVASIVLVAAAGANIPLLLAGVVLFGVGIGNVTSLPPLIAQVEFGKEAEFGKEEVARVVALIVAVSQGTYAFAPAVFGLLRELSPHAAAAPTPAVFIAAALLQGLAICAFMIGRAQPRRSPAPAPSI